MKRFLLGLAAVASLAVAAPALAHDHDDDDWNVSSYDDFGREYHHLMEGIQHGLSDGSFTPYQARKLYAELENIRARADWDARRGYYDGDETQQRLARLHARMHVLHERGHERLDDERYGQGQYGYGRYGYSDGGYRYTPYDPYRR